MAEKTERAATTPRPRPFFWRLGVITTGICLRYRVTGLAAEAAFFAILSLPPLLFGLAGTIGYVVSALGESTVGDFRSELLAISERVLTQQSVDEIIRPTLDDVLSGGRADVISLGFVLALWSGSRALNVMIDTVAIMYGLGGLRGIVATRALSFLLYVLALIFGIIAFPLVLAGSGFVSDVLPAGLDFVQRLYWPVVVSGSVVFVATLYHFAAPIRTPWRSDLPGAVFCLVLWVLGSLGLRWVLSTATGGTSIYGPLAAPIAVLVWLYLVCLAVLMGAAFNAGLDHLRPGGERAKLS